MFPTNKMILLKAGVNLIDGKRSFINRKIKFGLHFNLFSMSLTTSSQDLSSALLSLSFLNLVISIVFLNQNILAANSEP